MKCKNMNYLIRLLGKNELVEEQKETNVLLRELIELNRETMKHCSDIRVLKEKYNKTYHIK